MSVSVRDFLGFVVNPPPGDPSRTANSDQLGADVLTTAGGPSPGALGWGSLQSDADYIVNVVGGGAGAVNMFTGNTDYSVKSGDHAPIFQQAVNSLLSAGGPTAGKGGKIAFKGQASFASQLTVYPNIALVGQGSGFGPGAYGSVITSSFNGPCILVTNDSRNSTFVFLANFAMQGAGQASGLSQTGIQWAASSSNNVLDTFCQSLFVQAMGQDGYAIGDPAGTNGGCKVLMSQCYSEFNGRNGFTMTGAARLFQQQCYTVGNTAACVDASGTSIVGGSGPQLWVVGGSYGNSNVGIIPPANGLHTISGAAISTNPAGGINLPPNAFGQINGNFVSGNGGGSTPQVTTNTMNSSQMIEMTGNAFYDGRGSGQVANHINFAQRFFGSIVGNSFYGSTGQPIIASAFQSTTTKIVIAKNVGFNNSAGKLALPFYSGGLTVGPFGNNAGMVASTTYGVVGTDIMLVATGGTAVSITITDPAGNTVQSGLATYAGILPVGYSINFGAFSAAPTVYVGVV